jgi:hypothetical protein
MLQHLPHKGFIFYACKGEMVTTSSVELNYLVRAA